MFEMPEIIETIENLEIDEMASGQYAASMDWTGDCCYSGK